MEVTELTSVAVQEPTALQADIAMPGYLSDGSLTKEVRPGR